MKGKKNVSSLKQIEKMSLTKGTVYTALELASDYDVDKICTALRMKQANGINQFYFTN